MPNLHSVAALVLLASGITFSAAAAAEDPVTSSLMVPLNGLVFHPGAGEPVALTGRMHLVTQFLPQDPCMPVDPCHVFFDLADVTGVGLLSGGHYIAVGAMNLACIPNDPCFPQFLIMPVSVLLPTTPIKPPNPSMPIGFEVTIAFDATGHLSPATTVGLVCTFDICN